MLYFAEGFPLGVFFEIFPVWFRNHGVDLRQIGAISLLGLAWTLKFLWAPAIDHYRHHRMWMAAVDALMGVVMLLFAIGSGLPPWVWIGIAVFTVFSATNDIAIDGYTIEFLDQREFGLANGIRIGFYRVGMLASGGVLILSDTIGWSGAFLCAGAIFAVLVAVSLMAPREREQLAPATMAFRDELASIARHPGAAAAVIGLLLGCVWLVDGAANVSAQSTLFWPVAWGTAAAAFVAMVALGRRRGAAASNAAAEGDGPMFGALLELLRRPGILPVLLFILVFKLGDSSMGFMVKPFWVDSGFSNSEIGLVSVNLGLVLSIAGGLAGGWYADRVGIFKALWVLGLLQAVSNLGYALAAAVIPPATAGIPLAWDDRALMYAASGAESFTGGLGTAAFLAFLMAIVAKQRAATEYALLSSVFALSRSFAGWAGGFGAHEMGYAPYFLLTFFLAFPAYALLPWVNRMLEASARVEEQSSP
jgi:PAT family beta-lactamase induction signal transducer AmpG